MLTPAPGATDHHGENIDVAKLMGGGVAIHMDLRCFASVFTVPLSPELGAAPMDRVVALVISVHYGH